MISVFELVQVVVLVVAAAGISNVCERWAARTGRIGTARKSSAAVAKANTPGNQSVGDDIDEPALPSVKPVKAVPVAPKPDASKKTTVTDPKPQPAVPSTKEVPRAVTPPPPGAAVGGSAGDDDLDALLNSALDAEAEAEDLLDNILGAEDTDSDAKEKPASVKAVAAPKPEPKPAAAPAATKPKAVAAPKAAASSPPPKKDSMDDLLDSALDEVGEADALLDACLDNPDAASAVPAAADSKLTGQPDGSPALPADGARSDPSSKEGDPVSNVDGPKRRPSRGGRLQGSSSGDHDSSTRPPELVFPIAMRAAKRPAPDHTRASELMRMGRELLELRKFQAALDTLCSAHRFVNLGSDEGLRNAIKTGIRAVYTQHGEEAKFADEALPFL